METHVDEGLIRQLAKKIAKDIKTEADLGGFSKLLKKIVVETALDAELADHLGYDRHNPKGNGSGNSRNGKSRKRLKGDHGDIELDIPRDREGSFEPQIVKEGQSRLTQSKRSIQHRLRSTSRCVPRFFQGVGNAAYRSAISSGVIFQGNNASMSSTLCTFGRASSNTLR